MEVTAPPTDEVIFVHLLFRCWQGAYRSSNLSIMRYETDTSRFVDGGIRVGVDLACVSDVQDSIATFGRRYLERIFTPHEEASSSGGERKTAESLAARFAAKEATLKVLRPTEHAIPWRSIEVRTDASGSSGLLLTGAAADMAHDAGLDYFAVSFSHEGDMAIAVVLARSSTPKSRTQ